MNELIEAVKANDVEKVKSLIESEILEENKKTLKTIYELINGIVFSSATDSSNGENYFLIKQTAINEIFISSDVEISKLLIEKGFLSQVKVCWDLKSQIIKNENIELLKLLTDEMSFYDWDLQLAKRVGNKEIIKIIVDSQIKPLEQKIQSLEAQIQSLEAEIQS